MTSSPIRFSPAYRWTSLVGLGLRGYLAGRISQLSDARHWQGNSAGVQLAQLRNLLRTAAGTDFGRRHKFARLAGLDQAELLPAYRAEVPVADWHAFQEDIRRMREGGEPGVLWPGRVLDFAQTSGTTAGDKFIPVSRDMLRSNFLASLDIFAHLHRFGVSLPQMLGGKSLFLGGSTNLTPNEHGVRTGDLSALVTPLIRWPLSEIYLPGPQIALMSHWPSKIDAMAERCLAEDVRMVSGMCSWGLVLFERVLSMARSKGQRADTITDVWPNFKVFVHGGVKYAPFDPRVRQVYSGSPQGDGIPCRLELYPASEGFVAIQDRAGEPGLRLLTDIGNFAEFVPLEEIGGTAPVAKTCWEVEKGQKYVVVLSTCAGLWRYVLGDVVEFDTIPDKPLYLGGGGGEGPARLRIVGRHRHFINAFGENLIVENIENGVADASRATGVVVGEFTAGPVYPGEGRRPGLELLVEAGGMTSDRVAAFGEALDSSLKRQCVDYGIKRTDGLGMAEPTVSVVPLGTFHRWLESKGKLGGQHKCPRCANGREVLEAIKAFSAG
ncbi:MAG: GH3 auxin-responsive promoter family protein [Phycisphaerales bacterium]